MLLFFKSLAGRGFVRTPGFDVSFNTRVETPLLTVEHHAENQSGHTTVDAGLNNSAEAVQIAWRPQYFVDLEVQISWQAQYFVDLEVQICGFMCVGALHYLSYVCSLGHP